MGPHRYHRRLGNIIALLMVQIWFLSATLESCLAEENISTIAAAIFSGLISAICCGLYLFVRRIEGELAGR